MAESPCRWGRSVALLHRLQIELCPRGHVRRHFDRQAEGHIPGLRDEKLVSPFCDPHLGDATLVGGGVCMGASSRERMRFDACPSFARALPASRVFYAVKANPAPEVLALLAALGSCFDTASRGEIDLCSPLGARRTASPSATPSSGARHRARPRAGRRQFAVDARTRSRRSPAPRRAPGVLPHAVRRRRRRLAAVAQVRLRAAHGAATDRPRPRLGLDAAGISFHAGSQLRETDDVGPRPRAAPRSFRDCGGARHQPAHPQYRRRLPGLLPQAGAGGRAYGRAILQCAAPPLRQPHPGRSSSPAAAWSPRPA